jgi:hypothetical protein
MGKIATYPIVTPQGDDKIIVSQTTGTPEDATKNITVNGLASYIGAGAGNGIPTPEMFIVKRSFIAGVSPDEDWGLNHQLCIRGLVGANESWLDPTKEARLFMYTKKPNKIDPDGFVKRKGGWTHPSHINGKYIESRFGAANWGTGTQETLDISTGSNIPLPDIVTEWDIATELKILATGATPNFLDSTLRETTYIQVPFNQCQFLTTVLGTPAGSVDNLNYPVGIDLTKYKVRNAVKQTRTSSQGAFNTNTPWDEGGQVRISNKVVMRFVIGIVNPDFTLTNHTVPYIFGQPSDPITLVYQTDFTEKVQKVVLTTGQTQMVSRKVG